MTQRSVHATATEAASRAPAANAHPARLTFGALPASARTGVAIDRARKSFVSYLATTGSARGGFRPGTDRLDRNGASARERADELGTT
jgi:hypothetical protein